MNQQQTVIIDDKEYQLADLPEQAISQINNLKVTEAEIARQESLLAMLKTARAAYARLLGEALSETAKTAPAAKAKAEPKTDVKKDTKVNGKPAAKPAVKAKK